MKKIIIFILALFCLSACSNKQEEDKEIKLDPNNPTKITVWHYYNGAQQAAFDDLCVRFNSTVGKEKGIYVEGYSQGSVSDLEKAVINSANKEIGADKLPNIFSTYADTAYSIQKNTEMVNLLDYFSKEELSEYVDSFVQEGYINNDDCLYVFPVAKSTEILMLNKTDFEPFAQECNVSLDDLKTIEGVVKVAEKYYNWTDNKTPDIKDDGKAFYGRDSLSNYFIIGTKQLGAEIFEVGKDEQVTLNLSETAARRLWDNFYVPYVKGYFNALGKFRSDDVKTGDIIVYTGSSSSATYFPDNVEKNDESTPIDYLILSAPIFEGGEEVNAQQGAGMVVVKTTKEEEYASYQFLKWFTNAENNIRFACESSYMPVKKDAFNIDKFNNTITENNLEIRQKTKDVIEYIINNESIINNGYTTKPFTNGANARKVLDSNILDIAKQDRTAVLEAMANGTSRDEALSKYLSDEYFNEWYTSFVNILNDKIVNGN